LRWLVIGTGGIAGDFTQSLQGSPFGRVSRVLGSRPGRGQEFAERFGLDSSVEVASLEGALALEDVDAVYIASPHPMHEEAALRAIAARKPVLVEKPIGVDAASAARIINAAKAQATFLMEAYMYRCHPLITTLLDRLRDGAIGTVTQIDAKFCFSVPFDARHRLFNPDLGGGAILDVGGYTTSFAGLIAGLQEGTRFAEPTGMSASGRFGKSGVEEVARAELTFQSGVRAVLTCAISEDLGTETVIEGERGRIVLPDPWIPGGDRHQLDSEFTIERDNQSTETIRCQAHGTVYALEAECVARHVGTSTEPTFPAMGWDDTLKNMRLLDRWRSLVHGDH